MGGCEGALRCSLLVGILLCLAATSQGAILIAYFNNPLLPGDTQTAYPGSYGLLSSSFSLAQTLHPTSTAAGAGKATGGPVMITKTGDVSSANFELLQLQNTILPKVIISSIKGDPPVPLFNITLTNVEITSNYFSLANHDSEIISITLNYQALKTTYYDYSIRGLATQQNVAWNFALNKQA
ncbi:hypothetical protein COCOBI_13-0460 [Coccomyxa sp. Obi]|nr:hypothetical protein COCOBI_13-0460 [Coccomyxa sp. Obi]